MRNVGDSEQNTGWLQDTGIIVSTVDCESLRRKFNLILTRLCRTLGNETMFSTSV